MEHMPKGTRRAFLLTGIAAAGLAFSINEIIQASNTYQDSLNQNAKNEFFTINSGTVIPLNKLRENMPELYTKLKANTEITIPNVTIQYREMTTLYTFTNESVEGQTTTGEPEQQAYLVMQLTDQIGNTLLCVTNPGYAAAYGGSIGPNEETVNSYFENQVFSNTNVTGRIFANIASNGNPTGDLLFYIDGFSQTTTPVLNSNTN